MNRRLIWCVVAFILAWPSSIARVDADGFQPTPGETWHDFFCIGDEVCAVGDVTGDGWDDVLTFTPAGKVWVAISTGSRFSESSVWIEDFCQDTSICLVGDFDGDGDDDVAHIASAPFDSDPARPGIFVSLSNGTNAFGPGENWQAAAVCFEGALCTADDVDGDDDDDFILFLRDAIPDQQGQVFVALSDGHQFGELNQWHGFFCIEDQICRTGDADGDDRADIFAFTRENLGRVYVALSTPAGRFAASSIWHEDFCFSEQVCAVGDMDGDGKSDILSFLKSGIGDGYGVGEVYGALAIGPPYMPSFRFGNPALRHEYFCVHDETCATGDFNGDGRADLITFVGDRADTRRGDVLVALSDFGTLRTWSLSFEQLKIARANESGDDPYLIVIGFRSRYTTPNSTQVFWNGALYELGSDIGRGTILDIPAGMGRVEFPNVRLWTPADPTAFRIEILGVLVLAMESDDCSWSSIGDLARTIRDRIYTMLDTQIEGTLPPPFGPTPSAQPGDALDIDIFGVSAMLLRAMEANFNRTLFDLADYWSCATNPEDGIGYQVFLFPALDPGLMSLATLPSMPNVNLRAFDPWAWHIDYSPIVFQGGFPGYSNSSGAVYHVSAVIRAE